MIAARLAIYRPLQLGRDWTHVLLVVIGNGHEFSVLWRCPIIW